MPRQSLQARKMAFTLIVSVWTVVSVEITNFDLLFIVAIAVSLRPVRTQLKVMEWMPLLQTLVLYDHAITFDIEVSQHL